MAKLSRQQRKQDGHSLLGGIHTPTLLVMVALILPLYYAAFTYPSDYSTILSDSSALLSTPTGAMSAITGAAVSGEPACPTFPAGAGIGGGCRLIGTTSAVTTVPLECMGGSGCNLRVISTVSPTAVYTVSGDSATAAYKRIGEIKYIQDPASNVVSLRGEVAGSTYTNFYTSYGTYTPGTTTWLNYYFTQESAGPTSPASPYGFYFYNQVEQIIQGGAAITDSIRFRAASATMSFSGYVSSVDLPCQLSIDSSIEVDPTKFVAQPVPGAYPAASSCELYVCP